MKEQFIEAVKANRIEGMRLAHPGLLATAEDWITERSMATDEWMPLLTMRSDHLCSTLRRWLTSKGWKYGLLPDKLSLTNRTDSMLRMGSPKHFTEGSELDWHIAAVLYVLGEPHE